ncbi:hypothetical protein PybrP1_001895 [[Pythium] brassicae (nom. inval.)]|nr:hypothetical protein PybrP1_001895 [[Pythium] brassicae (nom. inval.)]
MQERPRSSELLEAVAVIAQVARSLYGPGKARKQVTDALGVTRFTADAFEIVQTLSSEHAALAIVNEALEQQTRAHGTVSTQCCSTASVSKAHASPHGCGCYGSHSAARRFSACVACSLKPRSISRGRVSQCT